MQATRQRILEILKEKNQATVEELSEELELTPVTIRHHLDILRGEGLVDAPRVLRHQRPGRPQYTYCLTEAASDFFPKNYHNLTDLMFDEIRERLTSAELERILKGVADRMAAQRPSTVFRQDPKEILDTAVAFLNDKGYVARWENTPDGDYLVYICNCPYERLALEHSEVCKMDATFVDQLIGIPSQRLSHMASGDSVCSYLYQFDRSPSSG